MKISGCHRFGRPPNLFSGVPAGLAVSSCPLPHPSSPPGCPSCLPAGVCPFPASYAPHFWHLLINATSHLLCKTSPKASWQQADDFTSRHDLFSLMQKSYYFSENALLMSRFGIFGEFTVLHMSVSILAIPGTKPHPPDNWTRSLSWWSVWVCARCVYDKKSVRPHSSVTLFH